MDFTSGEIAEIFFHKQKVLIYLAKIANSIKGICFAGLLNVPSFAPDSCNLRACFHRTSLLG